MIHHTTQDLATIVRLVFSAAFLMHVSPPVIKPNGLLVFGRETVLNEQSKVYNNELAYPIKNSKCFSDLVLGSKTRDFLGHHHQELGELDATGPVRVDVVDHVLKKGISFKYWPLFLK